MALAPEECNDALLQKPLCRSQRTTHTIDLQCCGPSMAQTREARQACEAGNCCKPAVYLTTVAPGGTRSLQHSSNLTDPAICRPHPVNNSIAVPAWSRTSHMRHAALRDDECHATRPLPRPVSTSLHASGQIHTAVCCSPTARRSPSPPATVAGTILCNHIMPSANGGGEVS